MKVLFLFVFTTINIFAQEKWISFEKKEIANKSHKVDINSSHLQSANILLQGAKIIFPLIDKRADTKKQNPDIEKKWFKINGTSKNIDKN